MVTALVAVVAASILYGLASVLQAAGVARVATTAQVLRQPLYLLGLAFDVLGWVGSLIALQVLPLFAVQPILAASLAVTVVSARFALGVQTRPRDAAAIVVGVLAVSVLALAAVERPSQRPGKVTVVVLVAAAVALGLITVAAWRGMRSIGLAALAGFGYALAAIGGRTVQPAPAGVPLVSWSQLSQLVAQPMLWVLVVGGLLGTALYARALGRGPVGPAAAALWLLQVIVPALVGVTALHDTVRAGWGAASVAAMVIALAAVLVLASAPGQVTGEGTGAGNAGNAADGSAGDRTTARPA